MSDLEELRDLLSDYHIHSEGHDPENFRECTHPNCVAARRLLKSLWVELDTVAQITDLFMNVEPWGPDGEDTLDGETAIDLVNSIADIIEDGVEALEGD